MTRHLVSALLPVPALAGPRPVNRQRARTDRPGALRLVGLAVVICLLATLGLVLAPTP